MIPREGNRQNVKIPRRKRSHAFRLIILDIILLLLTDLLVLIIYPSDVTRLTAVEKLIQILIGLICIFGCRLLSGVYQYVWRYGRVSLYIRLMLSDAAAGILYVALQQMPFIEDITIIRSFSIVSLNLLMTIASRLVYQYLYEYSSKNFKPAILLRKIVNAVIGLRIDPVVDQDVHYDADGDSSILSAKQKINVAIVGAGRVGAMLADELLNNPHANYRPCIFIDIDREKIGRYINGIQVLPEEQATRETFARLSIQEIIFAVPELSADRKKELYLQYQKTGCKIKVYDYPTTQAVENGRRHLREFDIEELLFREPLEFTNTETAAYYRNKTVLISGGGGSIGSELCRQIAKIRPKQLVILDVYENGAYDIQQELRIAYGEKLKLAVEIVTVCDRRALENVFEKYHPQIVLHAAAHKHVPLMEHNCCEAIKNNVFGTLNMVEVSEQFGVEKFIMISTDKAVNPTNVMGATKRMCEMIVQSRSGEKTSFSATRFGNVLGSNGSVIPLFKRQILSGGPVTLTDKRIIRYFMTIPEASQLVLQSGAMAKNGELYVLDMGKPVKILELAESMIRLSGLEPYRDIDIVETGLRPGEKLYEELLIKSEALDKTDNSMIFVERDKPQAQDEIARKLEILRAALAAEDDEQARAALKRVVPTYHNPEEVNANAVESEEMRSVDQEQGFAV